MVLRRLTWLVLLTKIGWAADATLLHLQTDRPSYRLGERIWYRLHGAPSNPLRVELLDSNGTSIDAHGVPNDAAPSRAVEGSFAIPEDAPGGTFALRLVDDTTDRVRHRVPLEVYDLTLPRLDLSLDLLDPFPRAGEDVRVVFRARDGRGRPVSGARVESLLTVGTFGRRDSLGTTNEKGLVFGTVRIPEGVRGRGDLAAGVIHKKHGAAVARPLRIATPIVAIDAFPEGGTITDGNPQRLGLFVRGEDTAPSPASGRINRRPRRHRRGVRDRRERSGRRDRPVRERTNLPRGGRSPARARGQVVSPAGGERASLRPPSRRARRCARGEASGTETQRLRSPRAARSHGIRARRSDCVRRRNPPDPNEGARRSRRRRPHEGRARIRPTCGVARNEVSHARRTSLGAWCVTPPRDGSPVFDRGRLR